MYIMDMQNKKELFLIIYVFIIGSEDRYITNIMLNKSLFLILSVWGVPTSAATGTVGYRLCAHLAVLPVCRSASLPRVPLCCHVWKQASALMYNTSLDPCFWYGCWQDRKEEKLVPKRSSLWDNVSYWATKRLVLHFTCEMVSESAYLCYFWFLEKTTTDKNASHSFNVICLYGWTQQLLCKNLRWALIGREVLDSYK